MFIIKRPDDFNIELNTPSFFSRYQRLFRRGKKVIYIKNYFDNSTFRYRCFNIVEAMSRQIEFVITYFLSSELHKIERDISQVDLVVLQRAHWDINIEIFISLCRKHCIPIIYDVDDLIINPKYIPLYLNNLGIIGEENPLIDLHFNFASKHFILAEKSDGFIVTNDFLGQNLDKDFGKPRWIIPNFLNLEQEYHSKTIRENRLQDKSKFVLGYFSGSPSHKQDLAIVVDELELFLRKHKDSLLKIVGHIEVPPKLRPYDGQIVQVPFVSFEELQYEIGEVDVNIVPLQMNLFNNCKSELKYFEAGIVNVISCCSPTYVYNKIIKSGQNGYICREGEWFSTFERIYNDRKESRRVAKNAFRSSLDLYGVNNQEEKITSVYENILKSFNS